MAVTDNDTNKKTICATIPSILPGGWFLGSGKIEVSMQLLDWLHNCVDERFFKVFAADSLEQAVLYLVKNADIPLHYRVSEKTSAIHFTCSVTWPLNRKGGAEGFSSRPLRQGAAPWDYEVDDTVFEIWRRAEILSMPCSQPWILMLTVGGRSRVDAAANWSLVASILRPYVRKYSSLEDGGFLAEKEETDHEYQCIKCGEKFVEDVMIGEYCVNCYIAATEYDDEV